MPKESETLAFPSPDEGNVLIAERTAGVLMLRLNRPRALNAIDRTLGLALVAALQRARLDETVRAVVLIGNGRAFCAGDDIIGLDAFLKGNIEHPSAATDEHDGTALYLRVASAMMLCPKPVIAAINGSAFGAGTEIACGADLRCMKRSASVGSGLVKIGEVGNAALLADVVGRSRAFEIFATGRALDANECLRIGLVHYVFDDDLFEAEVLSLAERLASAPTKVLGLQKQLLRDCEGRALHERLVAQDEAHRICFKEIEDAKEGAAAFLAKRQPVFTGR